MGDGSLSQDEIDALLQGADDMLSPAGPSPAPDMGRGGGAPSSASQQALRGAISAAVGSVAPALSGYLGGKSISITNPVVEYKSQNEIRSDFSAKYVQVAMDYSGSINGKNLVVFNFNDAGAISSLMMGDESGKPPADFSDAHQSTIQEFTNQFLASMATQFSNRMGGSINTSPAILSLVNNNAELQMPPGGTVVKISYDMSIPGVLTSRLYHLLDSNLGSAISSSAGGGAGQAMGQPQVFGQPSGPVGINPVKFPPLDEGMPPSVGGNISLLLDVPMTLTVELGRTTQLVQDILGLGEGSIIELDKLAGEPVDLLVNGKLIAKGEVVVIDENFGVRVTDIVSPADRLSGLQ